MLSAADFNASSIVGTFLKNRFPEPKEEPLLIAKAGKGSSDSSSADASASAAAVQQAATGQAAFERALQSATQQKETSSMKKIEKQEESYTSAPRGCPKASRADPYDALRVKASYASLLQQF